MLQGNTQKPWQSQSCQTCHYIMSEFTVIRQKRTRWSWQQQQQHRELTEDRINLEHCYGTSQYTKLHTSDQILQLFFLLSFYFLFSFSFFFFLFLSFFFFFPCSSLVGGGNKSWTPHHLHWGWLAHRGTHALFQRHYDVHTSLTCDWKSHWAGRGW